MGLPLPRRTVGFCVHQKRARLFLANSHCGYARAMLDAELNRLLALFENTISEVSRPRTQVRIFATTPTWLKICSKSRLQILLGRWTLAHLHRLHHFKDTEPIRV